MTELSLVNAQTIVAKALGHARAKEFKPMSVVVLDARGSISAAATEDGASLGRWRIAAGKAHGALFLGVGSRTIGAMALDRPHFTGSVAHLTDAGFVPVAGGVLIRDAGGRILGAVGVSGDSSDNDEACAAAGVAAVGLTADVG